MAVIACVAIQHVFVFCRYGFVVYGDGTVTDVACKGLNGMRMGDRTLTVRRATEVTSSLHAVSMLSKCTYVPAISNTLCNMTARCRARDKNVLCHVG